MSKKKPNQPKKRSQEYSSIVVKIDERGVLRITLNRPERRNAFDEQLIRELTHVLKNEALESRVRVIVLNGTGKVFCAGGDLNWMKKSVDLSYQGNLKDTKALTHMFSLFNEVPKPVIGLIHGAAIGGAVGLVSICDIAIAVKSTQFGLSEVRLGLIPACIGPFVISKIGASHARGLFMIGERFDAQKAMHVGLIHQVVESEEDLESEAERLIGNILLCAPGAMTYAKKLVLELSWPEKRKKMKNCYDFVSVMLAKLRVSREGQDGVRAFLEKRLPNWN